jgi:hypothetical protein
MSRISRQPATFSKGPVKSQTVIPREVREHLKLKQGDTLRIASPTTEFCSIRRPQRPWRRI